MAEEGARKNRQRTVGAACSERTEGTTDAQILGSRQVGREWAVGLNAPVLLLATLCLSTGVRVEVRPASQRAL